MVMDHYTQLFNNHLIKNDKLIQVTSCVMNENKTIKIQATHSKMITFDSFMVAVKTGLLEEK